VVKLGGTKTRIKYKPKVQVGTMGQQSSTLPETSATLMSAQLPHRGIRQSYRITYRVTCLHDPVAPRQKSLWPLDVLWLPGQPEQAVFRLLVDQLQPRV